MARAPVATSWLWSTWTLEVARAEPVASSPLYQITVLASVPGAGAVAAASKGGPGTRSGGLFGLPAKKLSAATCADAAERVVFASRDSAASIVSRSLIAVVALSGPIAKLPWAVPSVPSARAVSVISSTVSSGSLSLIVSVSPGSGVPTTSTARFAGGPAV